MGRKAIQTTKVARKDTEPSTDDIPSPPAATRVAVEGGVTKVTITIAEMKFSPVDFNYFSVGPIFLSSDVPPGEDIEAKMDELWGIAHRQFKREYKLALQFYVAALKINDAKVREGSNG